MKFHALWFAGWSVLVACDANAALFSDEEAHNQIRQLLGRVSTLEGNSKQQAEMIRQHMEMEKQQTGTRKQQSGQIYDVQKQVETLKTELRILRGQNEELMHALQDAEKRQKDFYIDLDSRLRRFEKPEATPSPKPIR